MRHYIDTNILVYLLGSERDEISSDVKMLFSDYGNTFLTSTVCVHELIHLYQIGKFAMKVGGKAADIKDFTDWLDAMDIKIIPVMVKHLRRLAALPFINDHRDPNDRLIIAQAISDRIPLISSDRKFCKYSVDGLEFVLNER